MNVKDFIKETLTQIAEGVNETNLQLGNQHSFVATENITNESGFPKNDTYSFKDGTAHLVREIHFDLAITVSDASAQSGKGAIEVFSLFHAGGSKESQNTSLMTHKLYFSLPLALPVKPKQ